MARRAPTRGAGARGAAVRAALERVAAVERGDGGGATLGMAYSRALAVFAAMVGVQVVTAHDAMPPALFELVARGRGGAPPTASRSPRSARR